MRREEENGHYPGLQRTKNAEGGRPAEKLGKDLWSQYDWAKTCACACVG